MTTTVSYSYAREHFAEILERVENSQEAVVLRRRGHADMALVPADELSNLRETVHLLRSPANATRLFAAHGAALLPACRAPP